MFFKEKMLQKSVLRLNRPAHLRILSEKYSISFLIVTGNQTFPIFLNIIMASGLNVRKM
jgi:hypothetical protein